MVNYSAGDNGGVLVLSRQEARAGDGWGDRWLQRVRDAGLLEPRTAGLQTLDLFWACPRPQTRPEVYCLQAVEECMLMRIVPQGKPAQRHRTPARRRAVGGRRDGVL
jgi:hypothetical protein